MESGVSVDYDKLAISEFVQKNYSVNPRLIECFDTGVMNTNYRVHSSEGSFVFRIYKHKIYDEVLFEVEILEALKKRNFLAPRLVPTQGGGSLLTYEGNPCLLYEYIEGAPMKRVEEKSLHAVGVLMGRLHGTLFDVVIQADKQTWEPDALYTLFLENKEKLLDSNFVDAKELIALCESELPVYVFPEGLPKGVTHQDIKPENIIVEKNEVKAFIDFDNSYIGAFLHDITTTLIWTCFKDKKLNINLVHSFLSGYEAERSLVSEEREYLCSAIKHRLLREAFIGPLVTLHRPELSKKRSEHFRLLYKILKEQKIKI